MVNESKKTRTRNPEQTRAHILAQSTGLFAAKGFEGTTISEIVAATGFNKRMIYHYYGDKKGLYRAIFVHEWAQLKESFDRAFQQRIEEASEKPVDSRELVQDALSIFFDFIASNQNFVRLMMWEGLEGGEISRSIWKEVRGPLYIQMEFLIKQAQSEGSLDSQLDPAHLVISFMGAISFYFAYASTMEDILGEDALTPQALKKRKSQLLRLMENLRS